jgi:transposase
MRACRTEDRTRPTFPTKSGAFVAPYLALVRRDAPQRTHDLREVLDALRWIVRAGAPWRMLCPTTSRPGRPSTSRRSGGWPAGVFETMAHDLRGCCGWPSAASRSPRAGAHGGDPRQPHAALHPRERCAQGL